MTAHSGYDIPPTPCSGGRCCSPDGAAERLRRSTAGSDAPARDDVERQILDDVRAVLDDRDQLRASYTEAHDDRSAYYGRIIRAQDLVDELNDDDIAPHLRERLLRVLGGAR